MTLVRYQNTLPAWDVLGHLSRDLNRLFETSEDSALAANWQPSVDIKNEANRYVVYADLPGVAANDIEITAENGVLTIKGERVTESKTESEGYLKTERVRGSFFRRFSLPEGVNTDEISAKSVDGVLEVTVPKVPAVAPRKIAVNS